MPRGSNLPAIGVYNQSVVLDAIRRAGGLSRVEIAERTGLTAQTIGKVSRRLLDDGLISETGTVSNGPGKPRTTLELRAPGRLAVGVHIDPAVLTFVLLDLRGEVVAHSRARTPSASRPSQVIDVVARCVDELVDASGVDRARLLGIGIASPGPVDVVAGVVLDPPMLPRWRHVPLREALGVATGLPVLLEKDVTAAAATDLWVHSSETRRNLAFIYYGTGFGAGLVIDDEAVRGAGSNGGNIGHLTVDDGGPVCPCGRVGCLGQLVTPQALVLEGIATGALEAPATPVDETTDMATVEEAFRRLAALAEAGEPAAVQVLDRAVQRLARAVVLVVNLLDIDEVVFGGPFWPPIADHVLARLPEQVMGSGALISTHPVRFRTSEVGDDVAAVGAACLVLDSALSPRPSSMLISA